MVEVKYPFCVISLKPLVYFCFGFSGQIGGLRGGKEIGTPRRASGLAITSWGFVKDKGVRVVAAPDGVWHKDSHYRS